MQALHTHIARDGFHLRGTEMSRVDGFSDVVFGFALTLLVVSLEVPHTYAELHESLRGFIPFAICFALLFNLWYTHYEFFRRFGLHDLGTISLNAALLFFVLFYVYPLKFLFTYLVNRFTGGHGEVRLPNGALEAMLEGDQLASLMLIFGVGYLAVFVVFVLLYWHAYRKRAALELNQLEVFDTRNSIQECALNCGVALFSMSLLLIGGPKFAGLSGISYMLTGVVMGINGTVMGTRRRKLENQFESDAEVESVQS